MAEFSDYISKIKSGIYKPRARIELLRRDETTEAVILSDVIGGQIDVSRNNGVRRACSISFAITTQEEQDLFIPNRYGIWIAKKIKLFAGIQMDDGTDFLFPQGVFVMSNPSIVSIGGSTVITLNGIDKFSLMNGTNGGVLTNILQVTNGSNLNDFIRATIQTTNKIYTDPVDPILQGTSVLTPSVNSSYTLRKEQGEDLSSLLKEIAFFLSRNIFYDENGRLRCQDDYPDNIKASLWDFNFDDDRYTYLGSTHDFLFEEMKNMVVVIGANVNGDIATGIARNTNPLSPTNVGQIGENPEVIFNDAYRTDAEAQAFAEWLLKRFNALNSSITITSMQLFHLDVDQVITLTNQVLRLGRFRFLIQGYSLPLFPGGTMTISCVASDEVEIGSQV